MAQLNDMPGVVIALLVAGTVFVAGFLVLSNLETASQIDDGNASTQSAGEAAVNNMSSSLTNIVSYAPTWGVIIGA